MCDHDWRSCRILVLMFIILSAIHLGAVQGHSGVRHRLDRSPRGDSGLGVLVTDAEPLVLQARESEGLSWPSDNPKNGTPWYRMKPVAERGESSHEHFGSLQATGDFAVDVLEAHNTVRERAGVAPLEWSDGLGALAARRVRKLAEQGCYIKHSRLAERWNESGFQYVGENLYKVINMKPTGVDVVDAWYAEIEDYNYGPVGAACTKKRCANRSSPPCTLGHFTQVMWSESTHLGCARAQCPREAKETHIAICHYGPGGNIVGRVPFTPVLSQALGFSTDACSAPSGWPEESGHTTAALKDAVVRSASTWAARWGILLHVLMWLWLSPWSFVCI